MSKLVLSGDTSGSVTLDAPAVSGTTTLTLPTTSGTVVTDATSTGINASALSTGTVATARLASGTANNTTYLRGDQTWATVSTTPTTAQVLSATAGANNNDVGSYAFLGNTSGTTGFSPGTNYAGSGLIMAGFSSAGTFNGWNIAGNTALADYSGSALSGTWKAMGGANTFQPSSNRPRATLFLRVA
jgi:hypothetical protein